VDAGARTASSSLIACSRPGNLREKAVSWESRKAPSTPLSTANARSLQWVERNRVELTIT
jgi:hypothetical protein